MNPMTCSLNNRGFSLVELIISMVVVSIALGGVLMVMNYTILHSADPMLEHQAVAIAESYLEEVLLHAYTDPDGVSGESVRSLFDDVADYDGLTDVGARDQNGNAIVGLDNYTVSVDIVDTTLNGVACKRATVRVSHPADIDLVLSGYRTNY
jgi:MSHA pilin protein MshD